MTHSHSFALLRIPVDVMIVKPLFRLLGYATTIGLPAIRIFRGALGMGSRFSINDERGDMSYRVGTSILVSRMKKAIFLSLIISGLLLIGCGGGGGGGSSGGSSSPEPLLNTTADGGGDGSGGGGDGNNGGGGGNGNGSNGDGGGERPSLPAEVELSISPFIDGLRIQWHNLSAIEGAGGIYIHLNLTGGNPPQPDERKIAIEDFSDDSYEIDGLDNGTAYRLVGVRIEQANNTFWVIDNITWSEPWEAKTNALDNNGGGIVVGANHDGDGRADGVDEDDDNDGRPNSMDDCRLGEIGWSSTNRTLDYDSDGCRDEGMANNGHGEDTDDDNDDKPDNMDMCRLGELDWLSNGTSDYDGDGCRDKGTANNGYGEDDDDDNDMVLDGDEVEGCVLERDCDDDMVEDNDDIDDDGDGLIEIHNAAELDAVRWVLNGTGFKANEEAALDQAGCGNSTMTVCNGYELVRDISLTDFIARTDAIAGWQPIASDIDGNNADCDGGTFTAIFDGNGFEVSGLFINRSTEDCIGLFGHARGTIRHLGVVADKVEGELAVGGLVGRGRSASIVQSYAVSNSVRGVSGWVGGLVGFGDFASIVQSYAVSNSVSGSSSIGGLVGRGTPASIVQSYAVTGSVRGSGTLGRIGGLVGYGDGTSIVQSYAVSGEVRGDRSIGGLVGDGTSASIVQSYAVSGSISGNSFTAGGLTAGGGRTEASYWDEETSGRTNSAAGSGQTTMALRSPTDYGDIGIYSTWDDGVMVDGTNDDTTIYCDEDASGMIEDDEMRDNGDEDNRVWDFGTSDDYPALRCTPDSLTDQRAWWSLNSNNKPALDQDRLNAYLNGTLPGE